MTPEPVQCAAEWPPGASDMPWTRCCALVKLAERMDE
jgi:hypothetical protein